jgi:hypothetical protein
MAEALLAAVGPVRLLLAGKGYDGGHLRRRLAAEGVAAVITSTTSRRAPIPCDAVAHGERNRVERMWCRLKDFRRVATRYNKLAKTISQASSSPQSQPIGSIESGPQRTCPIPQAARGAGLSGAVRQSMQRSSSSSSAACVELHRRPLTSARGIQRHNIVSDRLVELRS